MKKIFILIIIILIGIAGYILLEENDPVGVGVPDNPNIENDISEADTNVTIQSEPTYDYSEGIAKSIPILMYHFFYNEAEGETAADGNFMEISAFRKQIKYLKNEGYYFPTWQEIYDFVDGTLDLPKKSIVITIDDGANSFFALAVPVLEEEQVKATSFVVTTWTKEDIINKYKSNIIGFESHSHDMHKPGTDGMGAILTMTSEEVVEDLTNSKNITKSSNTFCYPFGHYDDRAKELLSEAGFKLAVTTQFGNCEPRNG